MRAETVTPFAFQRHGARLNRISEYVLEQQSLVITEATAALQISSCSGSGGPWSVTLPAGATTMILPLEVDCLMFMPLEDDADWRVRGSVRGLNKNVRANRIGHGTHGQLCPGVEDGWYQ